MKITRKFYHYHWFLNSLFLSLNTLVLISSHGVILIYDIETDNIIKQVVCDRNYTLLYSCALTLCKNELNDTILIATGSAFGVINFYKYTLDSYSVATVEFQCTFSGHKGPIFCVSISKNHLYICSCADDRSICLWNILDGSIIMKGYGHQARIWKVIFSHNENSILSIGEDGRCVHWDFGGNVLSSYQSHMPREGLWGISIAENNTVLISCQSGRVFIWNYESIRHIRHDMINCCETIKSVDLDSTGRIFFMSKFGNLYVKTRESEHPRLIFKDPKFADYSYLQIHNSENLLCIGNLKGMLNLIRLSSHEAIIYQTIIKAHDNKIVFIYFTQHIDPFLCLLYASDIFGHLKVYNVSLLDNLTSYTQLYSLKTNIENSCITSLDAFYINAILTIAVGHDTGDILFFELELSQSLKKTKLKAHSQCCTDLKFIGNTLLSCGKDGIINVFKRLANGSYMLHRKYDSCPKFEWLAGIVSLKSYPLLIVGFYKQSKIGLYDPINDVIIFKIRCGGGHRQWSCHIRQVLLALFTLHH
ncbi:hypothetical protein HZS_284 [Henneguya salminicola]|nr:hypothetical protein HZS_284 [Henneguya salminicola]